MGFVFVSELKEVQEKLGWEHPLNDEQKRLIASIVLCERKLKEDVVE